MDSIRRTLLTTGAAATAMAAAPRVFAQQTGGAAGNTPLPPGQQGPPAPATAPVDVAGHILPGVPNNTALLGDSFLKDYGKYEVDYSRYLH